MLANEELQLPEPTTDYVAEIRLQLSPEIWEKRVAEAYQRVEVLDAIERLRENSGLPWRKCVETVDSELGWSCYLHWRRRLDENDGEEWERLVDRRVPPRPEAVPEKIREAAISYRQANPDIDCARSRKLLTARFGDGGNISDRCLQRIWMEADVARSGCGDASRFEKVEHLHGGAGIALLGAAALETGAPLALAESALKSGREAAATQELLSATPIELEERDAAGRFTAEFNHAARQDYEPGKTDARWTSDEEKRSKIQLSNLQLLSLSASVIAQRMLAIGMVGLLTERRGFDGLDGPKGGWLAAAGQLAYMPTTLDKTLRELALLDVGDDLWAAHGRQWAQMAQHWNHKDEESLSWLIVYVDKTADAYWTRRFALSGKVETVGRVMPCLTRVALCAGPGVPLLMSLTAGSSSLKQELPAMLDAADELLGEGEVERITVVDSEASSVSLLWVLSGRKGSHRFVTVLKGMKLRSLQFKDPGEWRPYGERDHIRTGWVTLHGKDEPEGGLRLNVVQRRRLEGRNPTTTWFATDASWEELSPTDVVDVYLSRWPNQEQKFRNGRNGLALERSHGFGGEYVNHVALETKLEQAKKRMDRAAKRVEKAAVEVEQAQALSMLEVDEGGQSLALKTAISNAEKEHKKVVKDLEKAEQKHQNLSTQPRVIYKRDTTRENIATALSVMVMMLIEYVLREYFGGLRMEFRTFIEHFVNTPTTVRTSHRRVLYQFEVNPRNFERTEQLRRACEEVSRRRLKRNGRLLVFEVVEPGQSP